MEDLTQFTESLRFTESELEALIRALGAGERAFSAQDAVALSEWAQEIRLGYAMLTMALQGRIGLSVVHGEIYAVPLHAQMHLRRIK